MAKMDAAVAAVNVNVYAVPPSAPRLAVMVGMTDMTAVWSNAAMVMSVINPIVSTILR